MDKIDYPIFLSKTPKGEDKFEGGSQKKLASVIAKIIREEKVEKKIIGLEGEWGSGKSNLIKIIQSKLGENYHTFIFDSWGSQEDLTRKSFLEQLINELFLKQFLTEKEIWKNLNNKLLSNTKTTHIQKFPKIKPHWLLLSISFLLFTALSSSYQNVLSKYDLLKSVHFGVWKPILWIYFIPLTLFFLGFINLLIDYRKERKENNKRDKIERDTKWDTLGKLFYWFKGDELNSEEVQNVIEDEPSVKQFREYFANIENEIRGNGRLILVFDNLDRLDNEKLKSLWSSIHTFFAEDNYNFESWVIVPYDKSKLKEHLQSGYGGFISKTFSINFRITPPVVTQWEAFLNNCLKDAFGEKLLNIEQREYAIKLFDIMVSHNTIKPRQIINYTNDLVSLYKQWEDDLIVGNMKFRYIPLFVLTKDKILDKPNESIVNRTYLGNAKVLFAEDEDLDTNLSMITFGVKNELADEVLLDRRLKTAIREGDENFIKSSMNHKAFEKYFFQANNSIELVEKHKTIANIYSIVQEVFSMNIMKTFWEELGNNILVIDEQFNEFNDTHEAIILNASQIVGKKNISRLLKSLRKNFGSNIDQTKYYNQILLINKFLSQNNLKVNLKTILPKVYFNAIVFLEFVSLVKDDFEKYKINCEQSKLIEVFFNEGTGILKLDTVNKYIYELEILKHRFELDKISDNIKERLKRVSYGDETNLTKYIKILNALKISKKKPLNLKLDSDFYTKLSFSDFNRNEIYVDLFCIAISNFSIAYGNSSEFKESLNNLTKKQIEIISSKIGTYFSLRDLMDLIITNKVANSISNLKDLVHLLTKDKDCFLDLDYSLKNFDKITSSIYANDEGKIEDFIIKMNSNYSYFNTAINQISRDFFKHLNNQDLKLIKQISLKTESYFNTLSKNEIFQSFKTDNVNFRVLKALSENKLIKSYSNEFYNAYEDLMKDIASKKEMIPNGDFWDDFIDILNKNKLRSIFTNIRDILIEKREILNENEIIFLKKGLLKYGNLVKEPDGSTLSIIIPLINSDELFDVFLENHQVFTEIINLSKQHKSFAIKLLHAKYNLDTYNQDNRMLKTIQLLKSN